MCGKLDKSKISRQIIPYFLHPLILHAHFIFAAASLFKKEVPKIVFKSLIKNHK